MLRSAFNGYRGPINAPTRSLDAGDPEVRDRMSALLGLLAEERRLLERLIQKLVACNLVIESGDHRWIPPASDEVIDVEHDLGSLETARAMLVADICDLLGFANDLTLTQLGRIAPDELRDPLEQRRIEMGGQMEEVARLRARGARSVEARLAEISTGMEGLHHSADGAGYSRTSGYDSSSVPPLRFDGSA